MDSDKPNYTSIYAAAQLEKINEDIISWLENKNT